MPSREPSASSSRKGGLDASAVYEPDQSALSNQSRAGDRRNPTWAPGSRAVALAAGCCGLGRARAGSAFASELLARPPLPAASQWPALAGRPRSLSVVLAGNDGGDDAA